jgi:Mg-chelatase subunit ChlD
VGRGVRHDAAGWGRRQHGKSDGPGGAFPGLKEGQQALDAIDKAKKTTTSRRELGRHSGFDQVSPDVGELDEQAFADLMSEDPDEAMSLLADMTRATDARLRDLARRLAGRLMLDVARRGKARPRGTGHIQTAPYVPDAGDLDIDASTEAIVEARAAGAAVDPERLRVRRWVQPRTAVCLLVDRSGSMGGRPLATSAVAAAAVAFRAPDDFSVVSFAKESVVVKSQDGVTPVETVVDGVLALRGHGTTDLAGALTVARQQLARSNAGRKIVVLLSDCRATEPGDVVVAAAALDELAIVAPDGDDEEAVRLAGEVGAALTTVTGPTEAADALSTVLT